MKKLINMKKLIKFTNLQIIILFIYFSLFVKSLLWIISCLSGNTKKILIPPIKVTAKEPCKVIIWLQKTWNIAIPTIIKFYSYTDGCKGIVQPNYEWLSFVNHKKIFWRMFKQFWLPLTFIVWTKKEAFLQVFYLIFHRSHILFF